MAKGREEQELYWFNPEMRGVLPLERFHTPKSLQKFMKNCPFEVKMDTNFEAVIRACADTPRSDADETWINEEIIQLYVELFEMGYAHSVECYEEGALVGGLYGASLGAVFMGESMFSKTTNASKVALVELVNRLKAGGFVLLDIQFVNEHLEQFGAMEIPRGTYLTQLREAIFLDAEL